MLTSDVMQQKSSMRKQFITILTVVQIIQMYLQLNDRLDANTCSFMVLIVCFPWGGSHLSRTTTIRHLHEEKWSLNISHLLLRQM